jgi:hypothetical protein
MSEFILDNAMKEAGIASDLIQTALLRVHAQYLDAPGADITPVLKAAYSGAAQICLAYRIILSEAILGDEIPRLVLGYALQRGWIPEDSTYATGSGPLGVPAVCEGLLQEYEAILAPQQVLWAANTQDALQRDPGFLTEFPVNEASLRAFGFDEEEIANFQARPTSPAVSQSDTRPAIAQKSSKPDPDRARVRNEWFDEQCRVRHSKKAAQEALTVSGIGTHYGGPDYKTMKRYLDGHEMNLRQFKLKLIHAFQVYDNRNTLLDPKPQPVTRNQIPD